MPVIDTVLPLPAFLSANVPPSVPRFSVTVSPLITPEGVPTDSPVSAERRHIMKEEIYKDIHDLQVRVKLMEERAK